MAATWVAWISDPGEKSQRGARSLCGAGLLWLGATVPRTPRSRVGNLWPLWASRGPRLGAAARGWVRHRSGRCRHRGLRPTLGTAVDDQRVAARIGWRPQQGDFAAVGQVLPRTTPDQADVDHCPGSIGAVGEFAQHRLDCHRVHAMAIIDGDQVSERVVGQGGGQPFEVYLFGTHGFEDSARCVTPNRPAARSAGWRRRIRGRGSGRSSTWGCRSRGYSAHARRYSASPSRCCPS